MLSGLGSDAKRLLTEAMEPFGLGLRHYVLLKSVAHSPAVSQQRLARKLRVDGANLVEVIDELEQRRLVERTADPADRRRHTLRITSAGRRTWTRMERAAEDAEEALLAGLADDDREVLRALVFRLMTCRWQPLEAEEAATATA